MRSLIKGHRRSDSSTSDLSSPVDQTLVRGPPPRTDASPNIPYLPLHMTPPPTFGGSNQSAMSSPKKLLTPIKKMFGHHSKNGNLSATVDSLNLVVFGEFEPPKGRKPIGANSLTNLADLRNQPYPVHSPKIHGYRSLSLLEAPSQIKFEQLVNVQPPKLAPSGDSWSDGSHEVKPQIKKTSFTFDSKLELDTVESLLEPDVLASGASIDSDFLPPSNKSTFMSSIKADSETLYEADDDERDSDTSSQFSFVKDMVGGRNTSIKYYKTKSQMKKAQPTKDFLGVDDLAFDDEDAGSDYDFENNGLDDDDIDYDDDGFEANDRFNDFLSEESVPIPHPDDEILKPPTLVVRNDSGGASSSYGQSDYDDEDRFTGSPIRDANNSFSQLSQIRSPGYGDDFLDSYLDKSRLPLPITTRSLDLSLPSGGKQTADLERQQSLLLPGDLAQSGLKISLRESGDQVTNVKNLNLAEKRKSITDMMGILASLESKPTLSEEPGSVSSVSNILSMLDKLEDNSEKVDKSDNANAFLQVKASLTSLEQSVSATSPEAKAQMRQSIADMMNTLSILDNHLEKKTTSDKYKSKMSKKPFKEATPSRKRYSWCNEGEKPGIPVDNGYDENGSENLNGSLDQDLIDEINLIPEDFDFDNQPQAEHKDGSGFYRSNSYNKKPEKLVKDFNYQDNKIHTSSKTVTFYRGNLEHSLNAIPSRMGSNKSMTSITSIDDQDYDVQYDTAKKHVQFRNGTHHLHNVHVSSPLYFMSSDSISRRSKNLESIDESDIASI